MNKIFVYWVFLTVYLKKIDSYFESLPAFENLIRAVESEKSAITFIYQKY